MRILLATNQLATGGAEHFVVRLANELARRRHDVVVMASPGGELADRLATGVALRPAPLAFRRPDGLLAATMAMRHVIAAEGIEVVHANSYNTAIAGRLARSGRPVPLVVSGHGGWDPWKKALVAGIFAWAADRVVGCAATVTADLVAHGLPDAKARTIPNGIPVAEDAPGGPAARAAARVALGLPADVPVILAVGRLVELKGHAYLIEALARVRAAHAGAVLAIAGDGPLRADLAARAAALGIQDHVRLLGNLADVRPAYQAADVFAHSSTIEGLPLVVIEAMAHGLPVVATRVGGVPEAVVEGRTGWLVPPRDADALAARLTALLADRPAAVAMGVLARRRVAETYSLGRMVDAFEALYTSVRPA